MAQTLVMLMEGVAGIAQDRARGQEHHGHQFQDRKAAAGLLLAGLRIGLLAARRQRVDLDRLSFIDAARRLMSAIPTVCQLASRRKEPL